MSEFVRSAIVKIAIVTLIGYCLIMAIGLMRVGIYGVRLAHDYHVYWRAANEPAQLVYEWWQAKPFPYAPTMLLWIVPLGFVSKWVGYALVVAGSVAAFCLTCRPYLSKWAVALALISPPMVRCLRNGQVSALLVALMLWACGTSNRIAAGVAFGVVASIKPQLVVMAPLMFALNRDWRAFLSAALTFAGTVLLSITLFGPERWPEWLASFDKFQSVLVTEQVFGIGVTPAVIAQGLGLTPLPFLLLGIGAGAAIVFFARDMGPLEKATAIGAGSLLASPYALAYDLLAVVPFLALCAMRGRMTAMLAITGALNPLPLILTAYELLRGTRLFSSLRKLELSR